MSSYAPQLMDYAALKSLHGGSAAVSIGGFGGRGILMLRVSSLLRARLVRIARHIVDAVLLVSALGFAWMSSQYPFTLGAGSPRKIVGLVVYVVFGSVALERGRTRGIRAVAFELALCAVVYLISVAMARSPLGIFASPA